MSTGEIMLRDFLALESNWWVFFVLTFVVFLVMVEVGYRFGRWRRKRQADPAEQKSQTGTVLAALLALLGFLLAISFGVAADRFGERKALVLQEANAIGTTFLRADFLDEPHRTTVRQLLRGYTASRIQYVEEGDYTDLDAALEGAAQVHDELWQAADVAAEQNPRSVPVGLFIDSLNEVIDLHEERVTVAFRYRVPPSLLWTLYLVSLLAMGTMGLHFGLSGTRSLAATVALIVSFAAILLLIVDLDSPTQRLFEVSQDPLVDTLKTMEESLAREPPVGGGPVEE
jgi:hypothetical protein